MKTVAIIQARMSSSRLPGKVLMPLGSKCVLDWVTRAAKAIAGIDEIVVATSVEDSDDAIAVWCKTVHQHFFRGSLYDVLSRYTKAAKTYKADIIMRITADCPMLDPAICSDVLQLMRDTGCDYATNTIPRTWPVGLDCEVFSAKALFIAEKEATTAYQREHVTPYFYQNTHLFTIRNLPCPLPSLVHYRWTLDTPEDYRLLHALAELIGSDTIPHYQMIVGLLEMHPDLLKVAGVNQ